MENLRIAGERLGKYDLEKRHAIELEDYERARHKKNQMDEFRSSIYQQLNIDQLLETNGVIHLIIHPICYYSNIFIDLC